MYKKHLVKLKAFLSKNFCMLSPSVMSKTVASQAPLSMGFSGQWIAMPYSRGSSQSRDQTQDLHIAGGFFTI